MSIYDELAKKFLADLQSADGLKFPRYNKETGNTDEFVIPFDDILKCYCTLSVPKKVFLDKYKGLKPIELLPDDEFKELEDWAFSLFRERASEKAMDCMRILHTIGVLSNQ